eukprot:9154077-Pyramimonas_sp.AAC.1
MRDARAGGGRRSAHHLRWHLELHLLDFCPVLLHPPGHTRTTAGLRVAHPPGIRPASPRASNPHTCQATYSRTRRIGTAHPLD